MLRKKTNGVARRPRTDSLLTEIKDTRLDRRAFLRTSGLAVGGLAAVGATAGSVTRANAMDAAQGAVT
ncbi:MAG: hypothetical protein AAFV09_09550, partial [Pseudomonadota bacterium]